MRLTIPKAAEEAGVGRRAIESAMDRYKRTRGREGLRYAEDEPIVLKSGDERIRRWTTDRWIREWEDRCAERTVKRCGDALLEKGPDGLYIARTKDVNRARKYKERYG